jgi:hypothetical protein
MSGPIVRKYGFPNFEKIFGERDLQHGADESETAQPSPEAAEKPASAETDKPAPPSGKKKA